MQQAERVAQAKTVPRAHVFAPAGAAAIAVVGHRGVPAQASIIALTAGGAEGGATARPLGSSVACGTSAPALDANAAKHAQTATKIVPRLNMKDRYRQAARAL